MGMYLVFILGANAAPVPVLCGISAALLQYFMLVFFSWTAVEAFCLYRKLVKIMGVGQIPVLKISLVVWCKLTINETTISLTKEHPWTEHLTCLPKRGVDTLLSGSTFNYKMSAHVMFTPTQYLRSK